MTHDLPLRQQFDGAPLDPRLRWHCEPPRWHIDPDASALILEPASGTDFWQRTHYGFEADNGHFLHLEAGGDFVLSTRVTSHPVHQYDQAGLMVRISPACWVKTSVEFEPDGPNRLGAVITNGAFSDWSTQSLGKEVVTVWFRLRAEGPDVTVESSLCGQRWDQIRLGRLHDRRPGTRLACGLYACSPRGSGYRAAFSFLDFNPAPPGGPGH